MDRKRILSPKTHNIVLMILSLVGHLYPGKILLDCWSSGSKLQSQIMRFSIHIIVPKLIMALIVLYRQGRQASQCHRAMARQKNNQRCLKTMLWKFASKLWISFQKASRLRSKYELLSSWIVQESCSAITIFQPN